MSRPHRTDQVLPAHRRILAHPFKPKAEQYALARVEGQYVIVDIVAPVKAPYENILIWADGIFATEKLTPDGHIWTNTTTGAQVKIDRNLFAFEPGLVTLQISLWSVDDISHQRYDLNLGVFLNAYVYVPGSATGYTMPTVTSGHTLNNSRIIRALFHCVHNDLVNDGVTQAFHDAAVTHMTMATFVNPADNLSLVDYATWLATWTSVIKNPMDACIADGFRIIGTGDDFFRNLNENNWTHQGSFREQAIRHVAGYLRDTGKCDGVEMVDEVGDIPDTFNNGVWDGPGVFDYYPVEFIGWWRNEGGPPLAWPSQSPYSWETPTYSDYSSRYFTNLEWRDQGPPPLGPNAYQMHQAMIRAENLTPLSRPWINIVSATGPFYTKRVPGGEYSGSDNLQKGGLTGQCVIAQCWLGLAYGSSGFRVYGYDWALWRNQRASAPLGQDSLQTGTQPGDETWSGLSVAFNSIASREGSLIATAYVPIVSGPWVFGRRGSLKWAVNRSTRTLASPNGSGTVITPTGETVGTMVPGGCVIIW